MTRRRLPLALVLLLPLLAACGGDGGPTLPASPAPSSTPAEAAARPGEPVDEGVRAFRRAQLLEDAARAVGGKRLQASDARAALKALHDDETFLASLEPEGADAKGEAAQLRRTIEERRLFLLGTTEPEPPDADETPAEAAIAGGALVQGQRLLAWLSGDPSEPCSILVKTVRQGEVVSENAWEWPQPKPPPPAAPATPAAPSPAAPSAEGSPAPAGTPAGESPPKPPAANGAETTAPPPAGAGTKPEGAGAPADPLAPPPKEPTPATEPAPKPEEPDARPKDETLGEWALWVARKEKTLLGKQLQPAECQEVSSLLEIAHRQPTYLEGVVPDAAREQLRRFALASETPFAYNAPYLSLRKLQAEERAAAWNKEKAADLLVDESTVRDKAQRAQTYEERLAARRAERAAVVETLDRIVDEVDNWQSIAAVLSGDIQEEQARLDAAAAAAAPAPEAPAPAAPGENAPKDPAAPAPTAPPPTDAPKPAPPRSLKLRVLEAQEATVSMELGLIYQTALRAKERLRILDGLLKEAEQEAALTASIYRDYAAELAKVRSSRALLRLKAARERLVSRRDDLAAWKATAGTPRAEAYDAANDLIALNDLVQELVLRRKRIGDITASQSPKPPAPPASPAATPAGGPASPSGDATKPDVGGEGPTLRAATRNIEQQPWAIDTIQVIRRDLEDPALLGAFDADLVARHYEVAERRSKLLKAGLAELEGVEGTKARYDALVAEIRQELDGAKYLGRQLRPYLDAFERDYQFASEDLKSERQRFQLLLDATESYRKELLDLGPRSLAIRMDTELQPEDVLRAFEESAAGIRQAGRWIGGEADPDVGDWATATWGPLLAWLGVVAGVVLVVFFGRRGLDRWLDARAARIPALRWVGASVRSERLAARARKAQEAKARKTAEEALRAPPPAPPPPPPPKGPEEDEGAKDDTATASADESESRGGAS